MNLSADQRLQAIIDGTRAGSWEWNVKTGEVIFNERWATMLGFTLDELQPLSIETWNRLCHPEDLEHSYDLITQHLENKLPFFECLCRVQRKDGSWCWISDRGMLMKEADGTPTDWMMGTHIDVSVEQESKRQLADLAASVPGILFSFVVESTDFVRFTYVSQRSYDYFGLDSEAVKADSSVFFDAIHRSDVDEVHNAIQHSYESISEASCQFRIIVDDSECWFQASAQPIRDPLGNIVWHGMATNIDEHKKLEQKLANLAITDELTGLFNRRYMAQALNDSIELYRRYQTTFSLISLDLDYFKQINDSHGHGVGDRVLVEIGELMKSRVRATDIVSRMGGEEFLVLLSNTSEHSAIEVAEHLRQAVRQTELSNDQNSAFIVTVSGGVVEMTDDIASAEDLLKRSDRLLYKAKERGRDRILTENDSLIE